MVPGHNRPRDELGEKPENLEADANAQFAKQLEMMTLDMKDKIRSITEDVEYKVGKAMSEEIRRLSVLVDEFNDPFHPDPLVLNVYKSRINHHIEAGIGSNLKTRLSSDLQFNIENHEREMIERMTALIPAERQQISRVSKFNL